MYPVPRFFLGRAAFLSRVLLTLGVLSLNVARADHYSGASITYACQTGNQYKIYLDLYLDCAGTPLTPQSLYFSNACGVVFTLNNLVPVSTTEVSPLCPSQLANRSDPVPFTLCHWPLESGMVPLLPEYHGELGQRAWDLRTSHRTA